MSEREAAELLGVPSDAIGVIEATPISDEVDFLYNLALSTLELARSVESDDEPVRSHG